MSFLFLDNDDATRDIYIRDAIGYAVEFPQPPYNIKGGADFYRFLWKYRFLPNWELSLSHRFASQEFKYSGLDTASIYFPSEVSEKYTAQSGEGKISHKTALNPYIKVNYEYLRNADSSLYQDRQLVLFGINDRIWRFAFRGESGLQRNASAFDSVDFAKAMHVGLTLFLPWHLQLSTDYQKDTRFPDMHETHILRAGRIAFPNENLKAEKKQRWEASIAYKLSDYFFYSIGYRYERSDNTIMPFWAVPRLEALDSLPADSAFMWSNAYLIQNDEIFWRIGFELGNWRFYGEQGKSIVRTPMPSMPTRYYKGTVYWSNRFVEERLKVSVQFDADWYGSRLDYGLESDSIARPVTLRNYLALNFKSAMQIQEFILYARIENMNHSLMETEMGYIPPGIRFAYGIEWQLKD
jgi:hypothetical protein